MQILPIFVAQKSNLNKMTYHTVSKYATVFGNVLIVHSLNVFFAVNVQIKQKTRIKSWERPTDEIGLFPKFANHPSHSLQILQ